MRCQEYVGSLQASRPDLEYLHSCRNLGLLMVPKGRNWFQGAERIHALWKEKWHNHWEVGCVSAAQAAGHGRDSDGFIGNYSGSCQNTAPSPSEMGHWKQICQQISRDRFDPVWWQIWRLNNCVLDLIVQNSSHEWLIEIPCLKKTSARCKTQRFGGSQLRPSLKNNFHGCSQWFTL